ncbi:Uncharacterized protein PBTT_07635 [Plasmodiophora brassicae]
MISPGTKRSASHCTLKVERGAPCDIMNEFAWGAVSTAEGYLPRPAPVPASARSYDEDGAHLLPHSAAFAESVASHLQMMSSPMKTDGFLNWGTADPTQAPSASARQCPCCCQTITTPLQAHITQCFLDAKQQQLMTGDDPLVAPFAHVDHVKTLINELDLRTRLAMMESLYRLSKTKSDGASNAVSSKAEAHDNAVLALLFGKGTATSTAAAAAATTTMTTASAGAAPATPQTSPRSMKLTSNLIVPGEQSTFQFPI